MSVIESERQRRRTFAIISHPDAGKTTMTEKLLLFGGAIQLAGTVRSRKADRHATSDWMKMEQERGISVTTSVMQFPFGEHIINLLDTPGHQDFSEDTYRTLTAVDSALMMIDAARGVQPQTIKLLEVCRMHRSPIMTFINKMDREGRDPLELMEEIENIMGLRCIPFTWPIGSGREFQGVYNLHRKRLELYRPSEGGGGARPGEMIEVDLGDARLDELIGEYAAEELREAVELVVEAGDDFDLEAYLKGHQTPVFFGSALNNFGVREFLDTLVELAPTPGVTETSERLVEPSEKKVMGFVFKIQANMNAMHRDRIAFFRVCSGEFNRGMKLRQVRTGKDIRMHNPITFMAKDRSIVETAYPGDIVGLHDKGSIQVGDTFTEGELLKVTGIPHFAPELFRKVRLENPLATKALHKGLTHLGEEGAAQVFRLNLGGDLIVGAVGALQFEVVAHRLRDEYRVEATWETVDFTCARWLSGDDDALSKLAKLYPRNMAKDARDHLVFLARGEFQIRSINERYEGLRFDATMEMV
jgi:peptide chain release factor 3